MISQIRRRRRNGWNTICVFCASIDQPAQSMLYGLRCRRKMASQRFVNGKRFLFLDFWIFGFSMQTKWIGLHTRARVTRWCRRMKISFYTGKCHQFSCIKRSPEWWCIAFIRATASLFPAPKTTNTHETISPAWLWTYVRARARLFVNLIWVVAFHVRWICRCSENNVKLLGK